MTDLHNEIILPLLIQGLCTLKTSSMLTVHSQLEFSACSFAN